MADTPQYRKGPADGNQMAQGNAGDLNTAVAKSGAENGPQAPEAGAEQPQQPDLSGINLQGAPPPPAQAGQLDEIQAMHAAPEPAGSAPPGAVPPQAPAPATQASLPYLLAASQDPNAPASMKLLAQHILYHLGS